MQLVLDSTLNADAVVSDVQKFTYNSMVCAVESGIIARRWYEANKQDLANAGWSCVRAALFMALMLCCVVCYAAYATKVSAAWLEENLAMGSDGGWGQCPSWEVQEVDHTDVEVYALSVWARSLVV